MHDQAIWDMMGPAARALNPNLDPARKAPKAVEVVATPGKRVRREALWTAEIIARAVGTDRNPGLGWLGYHTHRSDRSPAGFPDLVLVRGDRIVWSELKTDERTSKPSVEQIRWLDALRVVSHEVYLWRPQHYLDVWRILDAGPNRDEPTRWPHPFEATS
jgi:hypothetical protein